MASLDGSLFTYGSDGLVAFESPVPDGVEAQGYIVFLGGLGDGTDPRVWRLGRGCRYRLSLRAPMALCHRLMW